MNDQCHLVTDQQSERPHDEPITVPQVCETKFVKEEVETLWDIFNKQPPIKE